MIARVVSVSQSSHLLDPKVRSYLSIPWLPAYSIRRDTRDLTATRGYLAVSTGVDSTVPRPPRSLVCQGRVSAEASDIWFNRYRWAICVVYDPYQLAINLIALIMRVCAGITRGVPSHSTGDPNLHPFLLFFTNMQCITSDKRNRIVSWSENFVSCHIPGQWFIF